MPSSARVRSTASTIFFFPSLERWDRPTAASLRTSGVHPGRLAQGPDEKSGRAGRAFGFIFTSPLQKSSAPVGERGPEPLYGHRRSASMWSIQCRREPADAGRRLDTNLDPPTARRGRGLCHGPRHGAALVRQHPVGGLANAATVAGRLARRLRGLLHGPPARLYLRDRRTRSRQPADDADGRGSVPDGDDVRLRGCRARGDPDDLAQSRHAARLRTARGALDGDGHAPRQPQGPGAPETNPRDGIGHMIGHALRHVERADAPTVFDRFRRFWQDLRYSFWGSWRLIGNVVRHYINTTGSPNLLWALAPEKSQ